MRRVRIIPVLTLDNEKLVKTVKFRQPNYIGDPINAVKIFNEKEVDEIIILDITASKENRVPEYDRIEEIASEAFMPFAYGGGVRSLDQIEKLFSLGIEKVVLNSILADSLELITEASKIYGSQSIVASIDIKSNWLGKLNAYTLSGQNKIKDDINGFAKKLEQLGAGEIFVNSIDNDGTYQGYDVKTIKSIAESVSIPVVASGGASSTADFVEAINNGASAVAAGSMFVYQGKQKGILVNYPSQQKLIEEVFSHL